MNEPEVKVLMLKGDKGNGLSEDDMCQVKSLIDSNSKVLNSRIDNLILSSGSESSAEVTDARTGYDGTAYATLGTAIRTQINGVNDAISDLDKIFYEQYIDIENSSKDYYWSNANTKANSEGFYAFEPFTIHKGTYYYSNLSGDFCFFKSISNDSQFRDDTRRIFDNHHPRHPKWIWR